MRGSMIHGKLSQESGAMLTAVHLDNTYQNSKVVIIT